MCLVWFSECHPCFTACVAGRYGGRAAPLCVCSGGVFELTVSFVIFASACFVYFSQSKRKSKTLRDATITVSFSSELFTHRVCVSVCA